MRRKKGRQRDGEEGQLQEERPGRRRRAQTRSAPATAGATCSAQDAWSGVCTQRGCFSSTLDFQGSPKFQKWKAMKIRKAVFVSCIYAPPLVLSAPPRWCRDGHGRTLQDRSQARAGAAGRAPSSPRDPRAPGRACRARFPAHPCLSTKVRVPGRPRSRAHCDAGHLTRKAGSFCPPLAGQGKWSGDLNGLLQDQRPSCPTGREARRHQAPTWYGVQGGLFPLQRPPEWDWSRSEARPVSKETGRGGLLASPGRQSGAVGQRMGGAEAGPLQPQLTVQTRLPCSRPALPDCLPASQPVCPIFRHNVSFLQVVLDSPYFMRWLWYETGRECAHNVPENQGEATVTSERKLWRKERRKKSSWRKPPPKDDCRKRWTPPREGRSQGPRAERRRGPPGLAPHRPTAPPRVDGGSASGQMPLREKVAWRSLAGLPAQEIGAKHRLS